MNAALIPSKTKFKHDATNVKEIMTTSGPQTIGTTVEEYTVSACPVLLVMFT